MSILRAGCFERVSSDEQAKYGFSIEAQVAALEEYCDKNNIKIVDHYTDEGVSAGLPYHKRPQMSRLLNDVKAGKIDIILFTRLDRWYRSTKLYYQAQEILDEYKVPWVAIQEDYETQTASGRFKVNIMLAVAEAERERGSERIKTVFDHKRKKKEAFFNWQSKPFGYTKEKDEDGVYRMVKDPEEEACCQDFWDIAVKYDSIAKAMKYCNITYGVNRSERAWNNTAHSEIYTGTYHGVEDYCEPYVSKEDWLKLQNKAIKKTQHNRVYLFTGLVRCPHCKRKLSATFTTTNYKGVKKEYRTYRCKSGRIGNCDIGYSYSEAKIEAYLVRNLYKLLEDEIASVEVEQSKPKKKPKSNLPALKEQLRRLNVSYRMGAMTDEEYAQDLADIQFAIEKAERVLADAEPEKDLTPLKELLETDFRGIYNSLDAEDKRRFWRAIIKEIHLDENGVTSVDFLYPISLD